MRLIDADRLKNVLQINFGHTGGAVTMAKLIDIQPTAYDIDGVVEKLKAASYIPEQTFDEYGCSNDDFDEIVLLDSAIGIVKDGVANQIRSKEGAEE